MILKRAGLAHQPIDHVPVVDTMLPPPTKAKNPLNYLAGEPNF